MAGAELDRFQRRVLGLQLRVWLIGGVVILIGLVVGLVLWTIIASSFLVDRGWWAWNGWPAIGAIAQILLVGTLVILWLQLRQLRDQAAQETRYRREDFDRDTQQRRDEFERANTPVLSVVLTDAQAGGDRGTATYTLVAVGQGVVHNVSIGFWTGAEKPQQGRDLVKILPSIVAPSQHEFPVTWTPWQEKQQFTVEVTGRGTFWQPIDFRQHGEIEPGRTPVFVAPSEP